MYPARRDLSYFVRPSIFEDAQSVYSDFLKGVMHKDLDNNIFLVCVKRPLICGIFLFSTTPAVFSATFHISIGVIDKSSDQLS
jgi:hypothetical protein